MQTSQVIWAGISVFMCMACLPDTEPSASTAGQTAAGQPAQSIGGISQNGTTAGLAADNSAAAGAGQPATMASGGRDLPTTAGTVAGQTNGGDASSIGASVGGATSMAGLPSSGAVTAGSVADASMQTAGSPTGGISNGGGRTLPAGGAVGGVSEGGRPNTAGQLSGGLAVGGVQGSGGAAQSAGQIVAGGSPDSAGHMQAGASGQPPIGGAIVVNPACAHPRSTCGRPGLPVCGANQQCRPLPVVDGPCGCIDTMPTIPRYPCREGNGEGVFINACCTDDDCANDGVCMGTAYNVTGRYCGGAPPPEENRCFTDQCITNDDCMASQVCIPSGAFNFKYNRCVTASCRRDTDCVDRAGGTCRPFITSCSISGYACHYDDDPCLTDNDCPQAQFQQVCRIRADRQGTRCEEEFLPP